MGNQWWLEKYGFNPVETYKKDGTVVQFLVLSGDHPTEDEEVFRTIGSNNFDNDGEDDWKMAGWCWSHDHWVETTGQVIGWYPLRGDPVDGES